MDLHDPLERQIKIKSPSWFAMPKTAVEETAAGAIYYKLLVKGILCF